MVWNDPRSRNDSGFMAVVYFIISCTAVDYTTKDLFQTHQTEIHLVIIRATSDISPHKYKVSYYLIAVSFHADALILLQAMPVGLMYLIFSSLCFHIDSAL